MYLTYNACPRVAKRPRILRYFDFFSRFLGVEICKLTHRNQTGRDMVCGGRFRDHSASSAEYC